MSDNGAEYQVNDPQVLLAMAKWLIAGPSDASEGLWPRAAALVGRQAVEKAIAGRFPTLADAPFRAQLVCIQALLNDPPLAGELALSWSALSHATHFRGYDLPPTSEELERWLEPIERFLARG